MSTQTEGCLGEVKEAGSRASAKRAGAATFPPTISFANAIELFERMVHDGFHIGPPSPRATPGDVPLGRAREGRRIRFAEELAAARQSASAALQVQSRRSWTHRGVRTTSAAAAARGRR
jgi:hypothetical protein